VEALGKIFTTDYLEALASSEDTSQKALAQELVDAGILLRSEDGTSLALNSN
jgi:hypothetical protein